MTFEPIRDGRGQPRVKCTCADCGREEVVPAVHGKTGSDGEGQAVRKITAQGWSFIGKQLRCPACEAKRKVVKMSDVKEKKAEVEPPRTPTKDQKREIVLMLSEVYDTENERYMQGDTDETVASVLGVMPGWVRELREELFGPDGGNEDIAALAAELANLTGTLDEAVKSLTDEKAKVLRLQGQVQEVSEKLARIQKAVGPRVMRQA